MFVYEVRLWTNLGGTAGVALVPYVGQGFIFLEKVCKDGTYTMAKSEYVCEKLYTF